MSQAAKNLNELSVEHVARWYAVRTRFKREKLVRQRLTESGIQAYLPLQQVTRRYASKIKHLEIPLINNYIFVHITKPEYVPVLKTPDVLHFVHFNHTLLPIPASEINLLRRIVGESPGLRVEESAFHPGAEVEVIGGELTGLRGSLLERRGRHTFVVALQTLGFDLHMQIDINLLRPLASRRVAS